MQIEVETAAFADAAQKAARVSPTKGAAFDRAAGLVLEVHPDKPRQVVIKATDMETTLLTRMVAAKCDGQGGSWRLNAHVLAGFVAQLPTGPGSTVKLKDANDKVVLTSGRTKANLRTIDPTSFPPFTEYDETGMALVPNLAQAVQQVAWAVDRDHEVLAGVHIDGDRLVGCNRALAAEVKCAVPVEEPTTAPLQALGNAMKNTAEVRIKAARKRLYLMPDQDTQATSRIYAAAYPSLDPMRTLVENHPSTFEIGVEVFVEAIRRQMVLCKGDRYPLIKLAIHDGSVSIEMDVPELGTIEDEIDCKGGDPTTVEIWFTPTLLTNALGAAKAPVVSIAYKDRQGPVSITDGIGYRCIAMPRIV